MNKRELLENLEAEDPDYVVDVLEVTSEELIRAFPKHVKRYVQSELGGFNGQVEEDY